MIMDSNATAGSAIEKESPKQDSDVERAEKQQKLVYLFSSVPPDRPNYKRGVLNALCYPSGHILEVSYKKNYFQAPLAANLAGMVGKQTVFVFVDYKGRDDNFVPVRYGTILSCGPKDSSSTITERTRIYIRFELSDLIPLDNLWDQWIKSIPDHPRIFQQGGTRDYHFVIRHAAPEIQPSAYSQADIWGDLVERVSSAAVLNDCIFLATGRIQSFPRSKDCALRRFGEDQMAYRLRPNNLYKMDLRIFDRRNEPDTNQEIYVRSSSELIGVSQPFATAIGGPAEHTVILDCKRSIENTLATLVVDVRGITPPSSEVGRKKSETEGVAQPSMQSDSTNSAVICARPNYLLDVAVRRSILFWFVGLVFLGVLLTSTSVEFFKDDDIHKLLQWIPDTPPVWALVAKVLGAAFLAAAAYLGFRKLPSGSPGG